MPLTVHLPALAEPRRRVYLGVLTTGGRDAGDVPASLALEEALSGDDSAEGVCVLERVGRNHSPVLRSSVTRRR